MLQYILGGHPDILALPEPWIMLHPLYALRRTGTAADYDAEQARHALEVFLDNIEGGEDVYFEAIRSMASVLYGSALRHSDKTRFLDKTPRYYNIIPELYRTFPKAKFIFLLRNPLAVLSSVLETWFDNKPSNMGKYNQRDMQVGFHLLLQGVRLLGEDAIVVRYEDLVVSPETQVKELCARLSLPFVPQMIDYMGGVPVQSCFGDQTGIHKHARPVTDFTEKWIEHLGSEELTGFAVAYLDFLGAGLVEQLGYDFQELRRELLARAARPST